MASNLAKLLSEQKEQIADRMVAAMAGHDEDGGANAQQRAELLASIDSLIGMSRQSPEVQAQTLQELARSQLQSGADLDAALAAFETERDVVFQSVLEAYPQAAEALETLSDLDGLTRRRTRALLDRAQQQAADALDASIEEQRSLRAAVQEMSTPIIPLYSGVLVLPLVGRIDGSRTQDITESLLEAIAREQADLVLLDITGIATLDTSVANHLMQTARAASLLGSQVVLVGISAEIAQTLVHLDVDLGSLVTLSDLQSGVEYALDRQGLAILPK